MLFRPVGVAVSFNAYLDGKNRHESRGVHDDCSLHNLAWNEDLLFQGEVENISIVKKWLLLLGPASSHFII